MNSVVLDVAELLRPSERLTVSQSAEKYRQLNNPGSYVGPWKNATTPYMIEPMDTLGSRDFTSCVFVGPAQCGKGLALDTPIITPSGWSAMGALSVGDQVYGADGKPTTVVFVSGIHHRPSYL
ncbi:MAG: phage terminase large subunit family protein [Flavobacteriales bacterium]|nr:phage terminase large subunit family protein [Flavobacteriales bacterium]